jgi:iron complex outermembrane receptor protein
LSTARGFKAGGYNGGALASQSDVAVVDPEKLTAYEVGIKSIWLDGRLRFNAAAFLYDYADQQVFVVRSDGPIIVLSLENAAKSRITGADFELEARPARPLLLTLSGSYLDASVTSFAAGQGVVSYKGNTLPSAPRWHLNGMARYTIPLGRSFSLSLQADARYVSKVFFDLSNNPLLTQGGNTIVNARVTLESDQSTWSLALWGKNLNDKKYFVDGFDNSAYGYYGFPVGEPRAYGLTLTKKF